MSHRWFRYVRHAYVEEYKALGWIEADRFTDTHHARYSVLMVWTKDGDPLEPKDNGRQEPTVYDKPDPLGR